LAQGNCRKNRLQDRCVCGTTFPRRQYQDDSATSDVSSSSSSILELPSVSPEDMGFLILPWTCIFCEDQLSSEALCRQHLEDRHVLPTLYKCESCPKRLISRDEMRNHVKLCGRRSQWYNKMKPKHKQVYACEYTGLCFNSMSYYVTHLLSLCDSSKYRPKADFHRKLRALLRRSDLIKYVIATSRIVFDSAIAWELVSWSDFHLVSAIENLEGARVFDDGTMTFGEKSTYFHSIPLYLDSLFHTGDWDRVYSSPIVLPNS
jgi:hypothetical protein